MCRFDGTLSHIVAILSFLFTVCKKNKLDGDTSVMTYKGHSLLHTLIRCHFSPEFTTGQRYVYTGCSTGSLVSKYNYDIEASSTTLAP